MLVAGTVPVPHARDVSSGSGVPISTPVEPLITATARHQSISPLLWEWPDSFPLCPWSGSTCVCCCHGDSLRLGSYGNSSQKVALHMVSPPSPVLASPWAVCRPRDTDRHAGHSQGQTASSVPACTRLTPPAVPAPREALPPSRSLSPPSPTHLAHTLIRQTHREDHARPAPRPLLPSGGCPSTRRPTSVLRT